MGNYLDFVDLGSSKSPIDVCLGTSHVCSILDSYELKCWGHGLYGQLGYGDSANRGGGANEMGNYLPAVNLGDGKKSESIQCGDYFSCAILNDDQIKCWGQNDLGQLGQGHTNNSGDEPAEMGDYLFPVDLGNGVDVKLCFDISPTLSPSSTLDPTINPTYEPTMIPSTSLSPSFSPSTLFPSMSFSPTFAPSLGTRLQTGVQEGGSGSDYGFEVAIDSQGGIIMFGETYSSLYGFTNKGQNDFVANKHFSNLSFAWGYQNGLSFNF